MASAAVMGGISLGSSVLSGIMGMKSAANNAQAQKLNIQGQMLQTMGQAFGFKVQAMQYDYAADINKYQAAVAETNRKISKGNAERVRQETEVGAQQSGMKAASDLGEMMVTQGSSGLDVSGPTATRVRSAMIDLGYYNQSLIRATGAQKAYGYEVEATQHEAQADIYRYTAQMNEDQSKAALSASDLTMQALPLQQQAMSLASSSGNINMLGSLVGSAGSVADKWLKGSASAGGSGIWA